MTARSPRALICFLGPLVGLTGAVSLAGGQPELRRTDPACRNASLVVGRSMCGRFGTWAIPPSPKAHMELRVDLRTLSGLPFGDSAVARRAGASAPTVGGDGDLDAYAVGGGFTLGVHVTHHVYLAAEVGLGVVHGFDASALGGRTVDEGFYAGGGGLGGAAFYLGPVVVRGELLAGARMVSVVGSQGDDDDLWRASITQAVIEPRVAAELWLSPWVSVGARVGTNLMRRGKEMSFGIYLSMYTHAFDHSRTRPAW